MTDQTRRQPGRVRRWYQKWAWTLRAPIMALAMLLLALSAIINAVTASGGSRHQQEQLDRQAQVISDLQERSDCRADLANRVNVIQGQRTAALADGLAAFADNNDAELARQTAVIHATEARLREALARQADQARICSRR